MFFSDFFQPFQSLYLTTQKPVIIERPRPFETRRQNDYIRNPISTIDHGRNEDKANRNTNRRKSNKNTQSTTKTSLLAYTENQFDQTKRSGLDFISFVDVPERDDGSRQYFKQNKTFRNRKTTVNIYFSTTNKPLTSQKVNLIYSNNEVANSNNYNRQTDKQKITHESQISSSYNPNFSYNENRKDKRGPSVENSGSWNSNSQRTNLYETTKIPNLTNNNKYEKESHQFDRRKYGYENIEYSFHSDLEVTTKAPNFDYNQNERRKTDRYNENSNRFTQADYSANSYNKYTNSYNSHTTLNPFNNRPGLVKPAVIDHRPPITNRPPSGANYNNQDKQVTQTSSGPEVIIGPDVDRMSEVQKRRYLEIAERSKLFFLRLFYSYSYFIFHHSANF